MHFRLLLGCALALAGCGAAQVSAPGRADLGIELLRLKPGQQPPVRGGTCWAQDTTPAVIETVTEQIVVAEEIRDDAGRVVSPASYQTRTHQRMVQDTEVVWFHAPCPGDMTVNFVATLQRALKARGIYANPVTGEMDAATAEAIRRFQEPRGLDSPLLSLAAAKELGIIATGIEDL